VKYPASCETHLGESSSAREGAIVELTADNSSVE
jgi:hypothetical protein